MTDTIKCQTHLKNTQLLFCERKESKQGGHDSYNELCLNHCSENDGGIINSPMFYVIVCVSAFLVSAITAAIIYCVYFKKKPLSDSDKKKEKQKVLQNKLMKEINIKSGHKPDPKVVQETIYQMTENNEENEKIFEKLDNKKKKKFIEEASTVFKDVNIIVLNK